MIKKLIAIAISVLFVCSPSSQSNTKDSLSLMPPITDSYIGSIEDIRFVDLQIDAVTIDMHRYLGWFFDKKDMMKKASVKAIDDLRTIKDYLQKISFTDDLSELRDVNLTIIDMLIQTYNNIDIKQEEVIRKDFAEYREIYCQYIKKFEEYSQKQSSVEKLSDCLIISDPNEEDNIFDLEKRITLLSEILDAEEYSPVLFEAFNKWRTQKQLFWHGLSNMSEIPNWEYNLKRWKVVQTIKKYIETNSDDVWAKTQVRLLLDLPNVGRGGHFGNDVLGMRKINLDEEQGRRK